MPESLRAWVKGQFEGRVDHAGKPYFGHCDFVAALSGQYACALGLPDTDVETIYQAGLCHDLLEDTPVAETELLSRTSPAVLRLVKVLTHKRGDPYETYFSHVLEDPLAVIIKLADATHNAMITRFEEGHRTPALASECLQYTKRVLRLQKAVMAYYPGAMRRLG